MGIVNFPCSGVKSFLDREKPNFHLLSNENNKRHPQILFGSSAPAFFAEHRLVIDFISSSLAEVFCESPPFRCRKKGNLI